LGDVVTNAARWLLRKAGMDISRAGPRTPIVVAGAAAVFAGGLNPIVYDEALTSLELASRLRPELESIFLLSIVVSASMYLVGGLLGDVLGRRRVLLAGLVALAAANLASLLTDHTVFVLTRLAAAGAVGLVIPVSIAMLAVPFRSDVRAVTLSIGFAALGLGGAIGVVLLAAATPLVGYWPSLSLVTVAATVAFYVARRSLPSDDVTQRARFGEIGAHVMWAFGLLAITASVIGLGGRAEPLRFGLGLFGAVAVLYALRRLRGQAPPGRDVSVHLRPVAFALIAGVALAFAQAAPLFLLPKYLRYVEGYGAALATLALLPLVLGFIVAGPIAGSLITRYSPRALIAGSLVGLGLADIAVAVIAVAAGESFSGLLLAALPLLAIGSGFIVGTSIRTAVIFASVPRRLPSTAAALNQTSILVGAQLGVLVLTTVVGRTALSAYRASVETADPAAVEAAVSAFERLLRAIETPEFAPIVASLSPDQIERYSAAFASGIGSGLLAAGLLALAGAAVTWFGMSLDDPLMLRWGYRDEA
jgi:MFS transporter, DHA2 family, multidrug resistance protein